MKILDLSWCGLGEAGGSAIVGVLKSNKTLVKIILTGNNLGECVDNPAVAVDMAIEATRLCTLLFIPWAAATVSLSTVLLTCVAPANAVSGVLCSLSAVELGNALKTNRSLKYIVLHHNPIGWQGARKLLQAAQSIALGPQ